MIQSSRTPLHEAACLGNLEVVTKLLDNGADADMKAEVILHWNKISLTLSFHLVG